MKIDRDLLTDFVARYPAQPATAFWRGIKSMFSARRIFLMALGSTLDAGTEF